MTEKAVLPLASGIYVALLQLLLAVSWTAYVIYLPQLAAQAGIPRGAVIYLLMLDQIVFTLCDLAMGVAADHVSRLVGRLGRLLALLTAISCAAFLALPFAAAGAAPGLFVGLAVLWAATSSALRGPPLMLLGKYAARPAVPWLASLALLGFGAAGALAPYLAVTLRDLDPRGPFVLSSAALVLASLALVRIERSLAGRAGAPAATRPGLGGRTIFFVLAVLLMAVGFQIHVGINSAPFFLRFAKPRDLELLLPVFWIGFSLGMSAASSATARWGGIVTMAAAGLVGAVCVAAAPFAGGLASLVGVQLLAGAAWGIAMMSAVAAALAIGATGREGASVELMYAMLALATLARMAASAAGFAGNAAFATLFAALPALAWLVAGGTLALLARAGRAR